jgi:DNA-binding IscR family transcriptional regulator
MVVSHTGAAGGTRLAKGPGEISLAEVYRAVSCGDVFALHPKGANQDCPIGRGVETVLCNLQKTIDRAVGDKLSEYTLKDVIEMIEQGKD